LLRRPLLKQRPLPLGKSKEEKKRMQGSLDGGTGRLRAPDFFGQRGRRSKGEPPGKLKMVWDRQK